ncbi:type I restriction endonuclease subunit R [Yersinia similis]|uniref:Type I restriction enzyme endonuclease subunit n=1 Tax=Yersinia similis TaxID=367190 RepID=A0A0T9RM47_9GAMM|nr:type I restriction endonuclease subunit R [Yersinia similis]CNG54903.1 type I restriction enzyme restriction subunit [Yersinia similis]CNI71406.1 type I restriction enzyme restriction subunit [Yersinia similis]
MLSEDDLERLSLGWFAGQGWEVLHGPDIAPDGKNPLRVSFHDVFLRPVLQKQLETLNPYLPDSVFDEVISRITRPESPDIVVSNKAFHHLLLSGVPVEYKRDDKVIHDTALLMDFNHPENNRFTVVNQVAISGTKQLRRPDVICYINGLPIAVIELKSPSDVNADIWAAFNQLQTYKNEISDLFICNEALVISDGYNARIGSLTSDEERFLPWKTISNEDDKPLLEHQLENVVNGFFNRELLLDYIRYFILFESDGKRLIKKIAAYHQFHAVREAVNATIVASTGKFLPLRSNIKPGSKKAGVVWHTQGSGKSISMCCYAGKLLQQAEMNNPTIVVVTDRNDLDGQLYTTFCQAKDLLKQEPQQASNRDQLREMLAARESGGIIFTTVQKFAPLDGEQAHPALNLRDNIVVISDEAHRSQYGLSATLDKDGAYKYGYAKHMRDALPNASFMGFTGTPVSSEDKDTRAVFGDYVSIYDIQDAVDDGATVPIYYESRLAKLDLNHEELEALSSQVDDLVEDEETDQKEKTKGDWSRLEKLVGSEPRIKQVAADLVKHFEARNATMNGKAMIVAMSRDICVRLYNALVALRPEWHSEDVEKGEIKIIMTGSASDKEHLQPHIYNKQTKKRLEARFKDLNDPLKIVIVRDMWLTGFDAPCCHTMYIDKPMRGHNLMQAIARVNRVFKDKPGGLVVDYIGIANELKQALKTYTDSKGKGQTTIDARDAFAVLLEKLDVIHGMFAKTTTDPSFDYSAFENNPQHVLLDAANYILGLDDGKKRYFDVVLALNKAWSLCSTLDEAKPLQKELAFLSAVKVAIIKLTTTDKKFSQSEKNSLLSRILDNAIVATGVDDVFALAGLDKPNIGLLSDEFLEEVREMPQRNLAVELLEKLLNDGIHARTNNNVVQEKKYSDRLRAVLLRYNNRAIETAQVIEELIQMAKEFQAAMARDDALGLNPDEIAFYDALAENESAVRELGDETLKKLAIEVTAQLRKSTTVDWQVRESVRARLRILVRKTLLKYKYPPDKALDAVELILKQAEVVSNSWTA